MKHAVYVLNQHALFYRVKIDVKTKLTMFDTLVVPILFYCSDVWGVNNHKDIDTLHLNIVKLYSVND